MIKISSVGIVAVNVMARLSAENMLLLSGSLNKEVLLLV